MLQIKIGEKTFSIDGNKINDKTFDWDLLDEGNDVFHIIKGYKTYKAVLVAKDETAKKMTIAVNGNEYEIALKDKMDLLLEKMGMSNMAISKMKEIKAPMPGLVLSISVQVGDEIQKGDALLVLEAMKMENVLKSAGEGKIKAIKVKAGEAVEKNQILIELE